MTCSWVIHIRIAFCLIKIKVLLNGGINRVYAVNRFDRDRVLGGV